MPVHPTVKVNSVNAARQDDYYHRELAHSGRPGFLGVTVQSYDAQGRPTGSAETGEVFVPRATETFNYDADGNLLGDGRWIYGWNAEDRLVSMETQPQAVSGIPAAQTEAYVWGVDIAGSLGATGGVGGLTAILDLNGETGKVSGVHFPAYDGNGNVMALVSEMSGYAYLTARYEYDPFGNELRRSGSHAENNAWRFSTKWTDRESGLSYYGYRYYDPVRGRWLNRDPIGEKGGLNVYGFVGNDGVNRSDRLGLEGRGQFILRHDDAIPIRNLILEAQLDVSHVSGFEVEYVPADDEKCPEKCIRLVQAVGYTNGPRGDRGRAPQFDYSGALWNQQRQALEGGTSLVPPAYLATPGTVPGHYGNAGLSFLDAPDPRKRSTTLFFFEVCAICLDDPERPTMYDILGCVRFDFNAANRLLKPIGDGEPEEWTSPGTADHPDRSQTRPDGWILPARDPSDLWNNALNHWRSWKGN